MCVRDMWLDFLEEGTDSGTRTYPGCANWHFGAHSLKWYTLFLPQPGILAFIDSPREALSPLRSRWGIRWGKESGWEKGKVGEFGLICKNSEKNK